MGRSRGARAETVIWWEPADVYRRLAELSKGLTPDLLREAIARGQGERASCTENDPAAEVGIFVWGRTVRFVREGLLPLGWIRNPNKNIHTTIAPGETIAIAVAAGDAGTGNRYAVPCTKYERGEQTKIVVERQSLSLFPPELPPSIELAGGLLYVLLVHPATDSIRCELSLPTEIKNGRITSWRERIILEPVPPPDRPDYGFDRGPDIDVPVSRRRSS